MSVSFDRIDARDYRHRCFIFEQLVNVANSKGASKIRHLKKAVEEGYCRIKDPVANDATIVYPIAFRMDKVGSVEKVRYTTIFTFNGGFYLVQLDPSATYKSRGFKVVSLVKLTSQQFSNFKASFAYDAGRQFGFQDAQMDRINVEISNPAPNNDAEAYQSSEGDQMMPAVIAPAGQHAGTGNGVRSHTLGNQVPAPAPSGPGSFSQRMANVSTQAEEVYAN